MRTRLPDGRSRAAILNPVFPDRALPLGRTAVKLPPSQATLVAAEAGAVLPARATVERAEAATAVAASSRRNMEGAPEVIPAGTGSRLVTQDRPEGVGSPIGLWSYDQPATRRASS